ncbi:AN1-type zinc finger protein 1 [Clonorchis sinensis]|uniref:AN1-type zinc finger protein 1 n=1 Tax=Clonorchis sinensis TaxID=79923 RepID=H2KUZ5_CLOSI|nr:AN1-type zinc finger protein 1 [Clonorchis sinensis]
MAACRQRLSHIQSMDLEIGTHCAHPDCKQLDFLPIQCDRCKSVFCKLHSSMLAHSCLSDQDTMSGLLSKDDGSNAVVHCEIESCSQRELVPFICEACGKMFCVKHKQKEVHGCSKLLTATDQARADRQAGLEASSKLDRAPLEAVSRPLYGTTEPPSSAKLKNDRARVTAAKLTFMKAKMSAKPAGRGALSLPSDDRFILRLAPAASLNGSTVDSPIPLYFGKKWPLGKLLDYGQEYFGIKVSPGQSLGLMIIEDEIMPNVPAEMQFLELSRTLNEYACEGRVIEGCLLHIVIR